MQEKGEETRDEEDKVVLQVQGKLFSTTRTKLLRLPGTFFEAMLGSGLWKPNEKGVHVIERDNTYFHLILAYLENGDLSFFQQLSESDWEILNIELDYFLIKLLTWDTTRSSPGIASFSNGNLSVFLKGQGSSFGCVIATIPVLKFSVKVNDFRHLYLGLLSNETLFSQMLSEADANVRNI